MLPNPCWEDRSRASHRRHWQDHTGPLLQNTPGQLQAHTVLSCMCDQPSSVETDREAAGEPNPSTLPGLVTKCQASNPITSKGPKVAAAVRTAPAHWRGDLTTGERRPPPRAGESDFLGEWLVLSGGGGTRCRQAARGHVSHKGTVDAGSHNSSREPYTC